MHEVAECFKLAVKTRYQKKKRKEKLGKFLRARIVKV